MLSLGILFVIYRLKHCVLKQKNNTDIKGTLRRHKFEKAAWTLAVAVDGCACRTLLRVRGKIQLQFGTGRARGGAAGLRAQS